MTCILVVEDETEIREMLVEVLRNEGFQIVEAATADAAIELLDIASLRLVVTDINLPGRRDGIDPGGLHVGQADQAGASPSPE